MLEQPARAGEPAAGGRHPRKPRLGVDVAGQAQERGSVRTRRETELTVVELHVPELHLRPSHLLGHRRVRIEGELERVHGRLRTTRQLAGICDAGERRDPGREDGHPVVGGKRLPVAAEVQQGVAQRPVGGGVVAVGASRPTRDPEAFAEAVPRVRERSQRLQDERAGAAGFPGTPSARAESQ